ncbi:MAG: hydantoinase/oxoprolinase family protein, partial [Candidatus Thorarchaeota archaeon]
MKIVGVDVGGTFTDIILVDTETGEQIVYKVPSTPEAQEIAVTKGLAEICEKASITSDELSLVVHGTTVATNAMIQRTGAKVCLVTTAGLEDVIEIGRQDREEIYALVASRPEPLVDRKNRIGARERLDHRGEVLHSLTTEEVDRVKDEVKKRDPESVAISMLFSYKNPSHERMILDAARDIPDVYAVASCDVLPEFREFERTSTTILEAYLGPLVLGYLSRLDHMIRDLYKKSKLTVMQSNGGTLLCSRAGGRAIGLAIS